MMAGNSLFILDVQESDLVDWGFLKRVNVSSIEQRTRPDDQCGVKQKNKMGLSSVYSSSLAHMSADLTHVEVVEDLDEILQQ